MSLSHKAYAFDWSAFDVGLRAAVEQALTHRSPRDLLLLVESDPASYKDPYQGEPLEENWQANLENRDEHELADYAITRYYDPASDFGLGTEWRELSVSLSERGRSALLGRSIGPVDNSFDPGRQGSYFQTPAECHDTLRILRLEQTALPEGYLDGLSRAAEAGLGLYQTF
jgi:hypothetical protein